MSFGKKRREHYFGFLFLLLLLHLLPLLLLSVWWRDREGISRWADEGLPTVTVDMGVEKKGNIPG